MLLFLPAHTPVGSQLQSISMSVFKHSRFLTHFLEAGKRPCLVLVGFDLNKCLHLQKRSCLFFPLCSPGDLSSRRHVVLMFYGQLSWPFRRWLHHFNNLHWASAGRKQQQLASRQPLSPELSHFQSSSHPLK